MLSYHNDPTLKAMVVEEIEAHRLADQIVQGTYGEGKGKQWRGCAVGCAIHSLNLRLKKRLDTGDHEALADTAGWPLWLPYLADRIFEGLPLEEAKLWPGQLAAAIPVGADLATVRPHFLAFVMRENLERVRALAIADDLKNQVSNAIAGVLTLHERAAATGEWGKSAESAAWSAAWSVESAAWSAARSAESAAWSAARSAAWSAESAAWSAESAAWSAARSAAWSAWSAAWSVESAAWSAESAARSAAWSAWSAAESAAYRRYAAELLRLLHEADNAR